MLICRGKFLVVLVLLFVFFAVGTETYASSKNSSKVNVDIEFLEGISGGNKFIFSVNIENDLDAVVKEFFVEDGNKNVPVSTYELSENKYAIVVISNNKDYSIDNLKLGATLVVNRSEENVQDIATLSAENRNFKSGQVVSEPVLLYNEQDKITIAVEIDDPWDTLKNVQASLVYPEFSKDFDLSFEKKHLVISGKLKQFVYIGMESFKQNEILKFNINLLFQRGLNDVSLRGVNKVFSYNFDVEEIVKKFVKDVYLTLLNKKVSSSDLNKHSKNLINKSTSVTDFVKAIVESKDFKNSTISDGEFIDKMYKITLNRTPDEDGKKFWIGEIKKTSRIDVLNQIFKSDEYVRLMNEIGINA